MGTLDFVGLDCAFLDYIGATPENQRRIQNFYLPFFEGCRRVLDLACGTGDFVGLLAEKGIEAIGVDYDPQCCERARGKGGEIICEDVFDYLGAIEPRTFDGIFSAHLVEHLPYEKVLELLELSYHALREGGRIVVTTPNVRGLFAHLEMFYLHFGHVSFYHPRLLCFFLEYTGFVEPTKGENPRTAWPLLVGMEHLSGLQAGQSIREPPPPIPPLSIQYQVELPPVKRTLLQRLRHRGKMFLVQRAVRPYLDQIIAQINERLSQIDTRLSPTDSRFSQIDTQFLQVYSLFKQIDADFRQIKELDRPFECYVSAHKPSAITGDGDESNTQKQHYEQKG